MGGGVSAARIVARRSWTSERASSSGVGIGWGRFKRSRESHCAEKQLDEKQTPLCLVCFSLTSLSCASNGMFRNASCMDKNHKHQCVRSGCT